MGKVYTINLPDIGEGVEEGEVIEWRKQINDSVNKDEPVVVVMTDKATVELPSPFVGRLAKQYFQPGEIATRGKPLYDIESAEEAEAQLPLQELNLIDVSSPFEGEPEDLKQNLKNEFSRPCQALNKDLLSKALATPSTRKLAQELGVDLHMISPSGKEGRVTASDVVRYHAGQGISQKHPRGSKRAAPLIETSTPILHFEDDKETPIIGLRNIIAEKMVESKYIIPHFSYFDQCDATRLVQLRDNIKDEAEANQIKLTFMPFFIRALSNAMKKFPHANSSVDLQDNKLVIHQHHHIGIASRTPNGLSVAVMKNVQDLSLYDIIISYETLKKKASEGKLEPEDLKDSTITISNFGVLGGLWATPIINYPEVAILGIAKIRKQPVVKNDQIVIRSMLNLSWSFDHRVVDGEGAAEFSNFFINLIENPAQLL